MEIIRPAEKIEVIESKKQCTAGSVGYLVYQQPYDMYNICKAVIVFIRLGNKGRNRIELMNINTVLVDINSIAGLTTKNKERAMENAIMPRYPDKYYTINASIKKVQMPSKNIIDLDIWDFFGYICSLSLFMGRTRSGREIQLPLSKYHPLSPREVSGTHINDISAISLAGYIYVALNSSKLGANKERSETNLSLYLDYFEDTKNRAACMDKMHRVLSTLREGVLNYSGYMIRSRQEMVNRIKATINNEKTPKKIRYRVDDPELLRSLILPDRVNMPRSRSRSRLHNSDIRLEPQEDQSAERVGCGLPRSLERSVEAGIGRYTGSARTSGGVVREAYRHITAEEYEDSLEVEASDNPCLQVSLGNGIEPMEVNQDPTAIIVDDVESEEQDDNDERRIRI